jgi:hypothetical protein
MEKFKLRFSIFLVVITIFLDGKMVFNSFHYNQCFFFDEKQAIKLWINKEYPSG